MTKKKSIGKRLVQILVVLLLGIVAVIGVVVRPTFVWSVTDETSQYVDVSNLKKHVRYLSETVVPRNSEHPQNLDKAAAYIKQVFSDYSTAVAYQNYQVKGTTYRNVIARFGPQTEEITVIGAHYDAYSELPGADDNASGVAGLLELGRLLSDAELQHGVELVAYTLEEPPYFATENMGSFVHAQSLQSKQVKLMVSLEMIGYFSDKANSQGYPISVMSYYYPKQGNYISLVDRFGDNSAMGLKSSINKYTDLPAYSINAPISIEGIDYSDHRNYWHFNFPGVMVTDTSFYRNPYYHTAQDTLEKIDYERMAKVVYGVFKHVQKISQ